MGKPEIIFNSPRLEGWELESHGIFPQKKRVPFDGILLVPWFLVYLKAILKGINKQKQIVYHEKFIRSPKVYHQLLFLVDCHMYTPPP